MKHFGGVEVQPAPVHPDAEPNPDGPVPVAPAGAVVPASRPVRFTLPPRISLQFHNALREVLSGDMLAGLRGSTGNLLQEEQALALTLQRSHDERGGVRLVRPVGGEAIPQFFLHPLAWERSVALCFGLATPPQPLQDDPDQTHAVKRPRQEDDDCKEEPIDESAFAGSSSSAFGGSSSGTPAPAPTPWQPRHPHIIVDDEIHECQRDEEYGGADITTDAPKEKMLQERGVRGTGAR